MKDILGGVIVAVPLANELTDQGVISALSLEESVLFGMTFGAWFKVGMTIALTLLIVERGLSIYLKWKNKR